MLHQFDYNYADDELREWMEQRIEKMARKAREGMIFFNNHVRAQAPKNALQMIDRLIGRGLLGG